MARRGGVELDTAVPDDPVLARCDPVAAEQAIGNVVDNAVAYGNRGGHVAVVLRAARRGRRPRRARTCDSFTQPRSVFMRAIRPIIIAAVLLASGPT
jgi:signal transduction histidine kinase